MFSYVCNITLKPCSGYAIAEVIYNSLFNKKVPDAIGAFATSFVLRYVS